ncbi:MAG: WD40 repeat domain-containing protein, partial [Stellaceae bacterium]
MQAIAAHPAGVTTLAWHPNGGQLLSGGADKMVRLWNVADGQQLREYPAQSEAVLAVHISRDGSRVVAAAVDGNVRSWNMNAQPGTKEAEPLILPHGKPVRAVAVSADNLKVATACDDGLVRVWDVAGGLPLEQFVGHKAPVASLAFAADNKTIATCSSDKSLRVWYLAAAKVVAAHTGAARQLAVSPDGSAVTVGDDMLVRLWDGNGNKAREFTGSQAPLLAVAVRGDSQQVAAGGADQKLYLWNYGDAKLLRTLDTPAAVQSVAFSADNQMLAAGGADNHLRVFATADGKLVEEFVGVAPVTAVTWTPDGKMLASAGGNNAVKLWKHAAVAPVKVFSGHGSQVYAVALS